MDCNNPPIHPGATYLKDWRLPGPWPEGFEPVLPAPHSLASHPGEVHLDEITPIIHFIVAEMNTNAQSADVKKMAELNRFSAQACITDFKELPLWRQLLGLGITPAQCVDMQLSYHSAALLLWTWKVRTGGDWDHKPQIATRFHPCDPKEQQWHLHGDTLYYYDIWSNLHYGYVGMAAGFSESALLDGAGLEQIGSDLLRGKLPKRSEGIAGMRAWDDPKDRFAIKLGIGLWPRPADPEEIKVLVIRHRYQLRTKLWEPWKMAGPPCPTRIP
ncbi:MAG: polymorphic toxin type 44 domain-containing protein [Candidatus Thiosymbion ectosymbiont of Robbea hypermnestra]|nr:polymorphic toxin type 44 domain-containing protein [Candidatus Thiosymbion ectosymbiont of Robbea hypermnestra]